jgi:hypothetical protein
MREVIAVAVRLAELKIPATRSAIREPFLM